VGKLIKQPEHRVGRPKGSRNKITLIKLMAEEAVRDRNLNKMLQVCEAIIDDALAGDANCRKLVWQSVMSKSGVDPSTSSESAPTILIKTDQPVQLLPPAPKALPALEGEFVPTEVIENG
jgi:hypothetical protein